MITGPSESCLGWLSPPVHPPLPPTYTIATRLPFLKHRFEHVTQGLPKTQLCFRMRSAPQLGSHSCYSHSSLPLKLVSPGAPGASLTSFLSLCTCSLCLANTFSSFLSSSFLRLPWVPSHACHTES